MTFLKKVWIAKEGNALNASMKTAAEHDCFFNILTGFEGKTVMLQMFFQ